MTVPHSGKGWRLAPALIAMEAEADRIAPRRDRASDGSIGDASHQARQSDHNPDGGVVDALDLTHSPDRGFDAHARARQVALNVRNGIEPRIDYIISNRQIFSKKADGWKWRPYSGINGHTHHAHFSIKNSGRNGTAPFFSGVPAFPTGPVPPPYTPPPTGPSAADLLTIQQLLQEDDDMIVIRAGKGIAHLVNNRTIGLNATQLNAVRAAYKAANRPLPELTLDSDALWRWYTGLD